MPRRQGIEGTVKETPRSGSGSWIALLPPRLCNRGQRTAIPGRYPNKTAARRALSAFIADIDRGRLAAPSGRAGGPVRRVKHVIEAYIEHRSSDPTAPLAGKTIRGYKSVLTTTINHDRANIGDTPVARLTAPSIVEWMGDLSELEVGTPTINAARRLLSAALSWEVNQGRLTISPAVQVRLPTSKAKRAREQRSDAVLLPTWSELATLVKTPTVEEDRLLIALIAWAGLRWTEAVSLEASAVWRDRPVISIARVLVKGANGVWVAEPPKSGQMATVPIPKQLWQRLVVLADARQAQPPLNPIAGHLLFRPPVVRGRIGSVGILDNTNFRRDTWIPARTAAGLNGDISRPALDPRSRGIKVKDLRAFAASVLADAGASPIEIAAYLRHSNQKVTTTHYLRAIDSRAQDPARMSLRINQTLSISGRLDALWDAWSSLFPDAVKSLGIKTSKRTKKVTITPDRAINRATGPARAPVKKKKIT